MTLLTDVKDTQSSMPYAVQNHVEHCKSCKGKLWEHNFDPSH